MPTEITTFLKNKNATLDYSIDWSKWLTDDNITGSPTWFIPTDLTKVNEMNSAKITSVWISGGILNKIYTITCRIQTTQGRIDERSFKIKII